MYILAFDTSSNSLSIALNQDQTNLSQINIHPSTNQSELLISKIEELLTKQRLTYQDLDLIATTNGPGSFTGSRIGLTAARIMKLANNKNLILLNSCQIIAYKYQEQLKNYQNIFVTLDARANEIFFANYQSLTEIKSDKNTPQIAKINEINQHFPKDSFFICGSANKIIKDQHPKINNSKNDDIIAASDIANLAFELNNSNFTQENLNPIYLRSPKITKRKK